MSELTSILITGSIFVLSSFYVGLIRILVTYKKFSHDNTFQIFGRSILITLSNYLHLITLRKTTTGSIFESITAIMLIFTTLLGIYITYESEIFNIDQLFLRYTLLSSISLCLFSTFTILFRKNIDLDLYILNIVINLVILISMLLITDTFYIKNKIFEDLSNIVFWLLSVRLSCNLFQEYRMRKKQLFLEHMYVVWHFGFVFILSSFYIQKLNFQLLDSLTPVVVFSSLFLITVFTSITKQYSLILEKKKLQRLIGVEVLLSFVLIVIRVSLWKI